MPSPQGARPRARSAFVAAFLSLLFPGLGHAYAGAYQRAIGFAAPPILLFALIAGFVLRMDRAELIGIVFVGWFLPSVFVLNLIALVYRLIAIVDAYRVAEYLNAYAATGGRLGRPRLVLNPVSAAGLLAVVLVMAGGHIAVARYDLILSSAAECVFNPEVDCTPTPSPSASPGASGDPGDSPEPTGSAEPSPVGSDLPNQTAPPWDGEERLNILLIGADEQGGGHNTDTLIVVSIDPLTRRVAMFSLPRDTVDVPIPAGSPARAFFGSVYRGKINSLFVNTRQRADLFPGTDATRGYNALKSLLGELYGLDIKYFVEVNFDGFRQVVDALGGVTINVQIPVVDDRYPAAEGRLQRVYVPAGIQHMTGEEALVYARSRHGSTDFDRGQRQQRVLLSLRQQTDIARVLPRIDALASAVAGSVRTDIPRDLVPQLLGLADAIDIRTLRSIVFTPPFYQREILTGDSRGYVIIPNVERIRAAVAEAFTADPAVEDRRARLAAEGAIVWVLNGSGIGGHASQIAGYLDFLGIAASAPNQAPDGPVSATTIVVYNGAEARLTETIAVLESVFGVTVTTAVDPDARFDILLTTAPSTPNLTPPPGP
ncbi:MAG TPA: LCP family protein [Candidatus Limnocylindrales bacterium]|nr:LCP family protein [Candidatus Limnocylindrales bacterium]